MNIFQHLSLMNHENKHNRAGYHQPSQPGHVNSLDSIPGLNLKFRNYQKRIETTPQKTVFEVMFPKNHNSNFFGFI